MFAGKQHSRYMSKLSQLLTINAQLHEDVVQPHNHKYVAHQLSLLYVRPHRFAYNRRILEVSIKLMFW